VSATQAVITVGSAYVSLGTSSALGMLISPQGEIMIIFAPSQPAANLPGHPLGLAANPYLMPLGGLHVRSSRLRRSLPRP